MSKPIPLDPDLERLLERVKTLPPMTGAEVEAQRRSWVIGEMMLEHEDMSRDDAIALYEQMRARMGYGA